MRLYYVAAAATWAFCVAAHADSFNFSYTGSGVSASGILTTGASNGGVYTITGISGQRNGLEITSLYLGSNGPDELLYCPATNTGTALNPAYLDNNGFSYAVGVDVYSVFASATRPRYVENNGALTVTFSVSPITAATPEPSSLALFATGLLGVIGIARKRLSLSRLSAEF